MNQYAWIAAVGFIGWAGHVQADEGPRADGGGVVVVTAAPGQPVVLTVGEGATVPVAGQLPGAAVNPWGGKSAAAVYIDSIDPVVALTEDQKKELTRIIEARDAAMKNLQAANAEKMKELGTAMAEAHTKGDKEAIGRLQKEYQQAYAPWQEAMKKAQQQLEDVLTPEQKAKQREHRETSWVKAMTAPVELNSEQLEKARAVFRKAMEGRDHEARERQMPTLLQDILTQEQKEKIFRHRTAGMLTSQFGAAGLTSEQKAKMDEIVDALGKECGYAFTWQIWPKLNEKVSEVLTPEQREAMKKARPQMLVRPNPSTSEQELTAQVRELRREVEELKAAVRALEKK